MAKQKLERATKEELERRIFTVQGWIIDGVQEFLIKKQCTTQWNISFRTAKRYVKEAFDGIKPELERTIEEKRAGKIAELEQRKRTMDEKFKKTPLGIRALNDIDKMIIKLEALEPPRRVQLSTDPDNPLELNQITVFNLPNNNREISQ